MKSIIVLVIVAVLGFFGFKSCQKGGSLTDMVKDSAQGAMDTAKSAGDMAKGAMDKAGEAGDMAKGAMGAAGDMAKGAMDKAGAVGDMAKGAMDKAGAVGDMAKGAMDKAGSVGDMAKGAMDKAGNMAGDAMNKLGAFFSRELPGGISLNIPKMGVESKLLDFIQGSSSINQGTWFDFDRINFATGSSSLSVKSKEQISNIASIMKAYPALKMKVGGYTDNTGSAEGNLRLSGKRAMSVKNQIVSAGIDASRLDAEGYGSAQPVASNDTAEGRQKNRRISLKVTAK